MLVLIRKRGQSFVVGNVRITIRSIRGGRVTLAIEAPREVTVRRGELAKHAAEPAPARKGKRD